jgi:hypothetical protein
MSLRDDYERWLKESGTPYVEVDEAKRALFASAKIESFDFVVYSAEGPNLLVTCEPLVDPGIRARMTRWQDCFGAGFVAVEVRACAGRFVYDTLDGQVIDFGQPSRVYEFEATAEPPLTVAEVEADEWIEEPPDLSSLAHCEPFAGRGRRKKAADCRGQGPLFE